MPLFAESLSHILLPLGQVGIISLKSAKVAEFGTTSRHEFRERIRGEPMKVDGKRAGCIVDGDRRRFSAEYKQKILTMADAAKTRGEVKTLLQSEGLHSSYLTYWRRQREIDIEDALTPRTRGPKPVSGHSNEELRKLYREHKKLTERLQKATLILNAQQKLLRHEKLHWPEAESK